LASEGGSRFGAHLRLLFGIRIMENANPTSPLNSECAVFSGVAGAKSSLHFGLVYFRQPEFEVIEENLLVVGWLGDAPSADVDAATGWENHVHHS